MADKTFAVGITIGLKDQASAGVRNLAAAFGKNLVPSVKVAGAAIISAVQGIISAVQWMANVAIGAIKGIIRWIGNAAKAFWDFGVRIIGGVIDRLKELGKWAALIGVALAEEFVRRSINAFADYEQAVTNAMTVTGSFGEALERGKATLFDFGLALSRISSKMPTEIAGAFYSLASAGLSLIEVMRASPGVMALAEGTSADMGMTTELVTVAMKSFQLGAEGVNRIVNVLAAAIGASRMNMERLAAAFPYAAVGAHEFGISLEQMVAALAIGVDRGLEATMAGTEFRMMLAKSVDVTKEAAMALARYGLRAADVNMQLWGMVPVLNLIRRVQMSYADIVQIFGIRAATLVTILKDNIGEMLNLEKRITGTNMAFQMQEQQLNTVQRSWDVLKSTLQEVQIRFAKALSPALRYAVEFLRGFVNALLDMGVAEKVGDWIGQMTVRLITFVVWLSKTRAVQSIIHNIKYAFFSLYQVLVGSIGSGRFESIVFGMVEKVAQIMQWLVTNVFNVETLTKVRNFVVELFNTIWKGMTAIYQGIKGNLDNLSAMLPGYLGKLWAWLKGEADFPVQLTRQIGEQVLAMVKWVIVSIVQWLAGLVGISQQQLRVVGDAFRQFGKILKDMASWVWQNLPEMVEIFGMAMEKIGQWAISGGRAAIYLGTVWKVFLGLFMTICNGIATQALLVSTIFWGQLADIAKGIAWLARLPVPILALMGPLGIALAANKKQIQEWATDAEATADIAVGAFGRAKLATEKSFMGIGHAVTEGMANLERFDARAERLGQTLSGFRKKTKEWADSIRNWQRGVEAGWGAGAAPADLGTDFGTTAGDSFKVQLTPAAQSFGAQAGQAFSRAVQPAVEQMGTVMDYSGQQMQQIGMTQYDLMKNLYAQIQAMTPVAAGRFKMQQPYLYEAAQQAGMAAAFGRHAERQATERWAAGKTREPGWAGRQQVTNVYVEGSIIRERELEGIIDRRNLRQMQNAGVTR